MKNYKLKILKLRKEGKTYRQIMENLGCAYSTVSYYLSKTVRENSKKRSLKNKKKYDSKNPKDRLSAIIQSKLANFKCDSKKGGMKKYSPANISINDIRILLKDNPKCYLTGKIINPLEPSLWSLDHKIPRSKGGKNTLENLGLVYSTANRCKHDLMLNELLEICINILENFGYEIKKKME
jgi:5-methylcytosine-specific restriction endonuclease McrA